MRFIASLFLLISTPAWSAPATQWQCQMTATLLGQSQHFFNYGNDGWAGPGVLNCRNSAGATESRNLLVSFNSVFDGFGADERSSVQVRIYISTFSAPADLQLRADVTDIDRGPNVRFALADSLSEARVYVTNVTPTSATRSLQKGSFHIRGAGESL